ncbi:HicA family toxin-antitoxin system [Virgibacillus sp. C22-A2]|uniref:HicA family toxin-antitoxin system n=1 Tax=Virgibacillus tibetensis TaxID=3042313 RepID=A0ABU6KDF2_9BACI|nr:HicA family toxin-antitoxin system [Virgibacillus sp. C22-A2]
MFPLVDGFEVEPVFEDRTYERHQFKLVIDGRNYKGDYHDGEITWLNPHPKQDIGETELKAIEAEVYELLGEHGIRDETDDMEIEPMLTDHSRELNMFKLKIQGEEFKGIFRNGEIEWFHPKPRRKIKAERVEKVEKKVQEKVKKHLE